LEREKNRGVLLTTIAWHISRAYLVVSQPEEKGPMPQAARTQSEERFPLGTAILSNVALSLLMWNIALRLASLFLTA
jgi:hypothetical protein